MTSIDSFDHEVKNSVQDSWEYKNRTYLSRQYPHFGCTEALLAGLQRVVPCTLSI